MVFVEIPIIKIGNSKGFRLSKEVIKRYNIKDKVELVLEKGFLIIKPIPSPRKGWEEEFMNMHEKGDDKLLFDDVFEDENIEEWS
jgi:antitoxin MazE